MPDGAVAAAREDLHAAIVVRSDLSRSIQPPSEYQPLQPLLGAVCHICQTAPSPPRAKISRRPSAFLPTSSISIQPPIEYQPLQPLLGAVCHMCQSAPSPPRAKISSGHRRFGRRPACRSSRRASTSRSSRCWEPSATYARRRRRRRARRSRAGRRRFWPTSSMSIQPPIEYQPLQPLLGAVCHICQRAPSPPRAKISRRPSAFLRTSSRSIQPPIEYQPLQPPPGVTSQLCQTAPSPPARRSRGARLVRRDLDQVDPAAERVPAAPAVVGSGLPHVPDGTVAAAREDMDPRALADTMTVVGL